MGAPATYENIKQVSLATKFNYRRGSYYADSYVKNGYLEGEPDGPSAIKRPGLRVLIDFVTQTGYTPPLGTPLASYVYQGGIGYGNGTVYFVIGGRQFYILATGSVLTEIAAGGIPAGTRLKAVIPASGAIPWQGLLGIYRSGLPMINTGANQVPSLCELDQTYYVLSTGGRILASALADIATWPALNYVVFCPDGLGVALVRHLQYLVAFSISEMKVYYNAGISPGAPIAQETSFVSHIGVPFAAAQAIQEAADVLYWLGVSAADGLGVYSMAGLQMKKISTPEIDRFLGDNFTQYIQANGALQSATYDTNGIRAMVVESGGHSFYVLTCPTGTVSGTTLAFDITTGVWYLWDQLTGGVHAELLTVVNLGMVNAGLSFIPGYNNGKVYALDQNYFQDGGNAINFEVQTASYNWGNSRTKLIPATYVNSDTLNTTYQLSWSDDDYTTYSTPQAISAAYSKKQLIRCGSTIERSWRLSHTDNTAMRFFGLEVEVVPGAL